MKKVNIVMVVMVLLAMGLCLNYANAAQEGYPNRTITVVVPWGSGGGDTITRVICKVTEKILGQPMVIENKPGAGGARGTNYIAKAPPDGYTIGMTAASVTSLQPHIQKMPFNPLTDIVNICAYQEYLTMVAVRSDAPWKTWEELINYAKNNPGKFRYATSGTGSFHHLGMEGIAKKEGISWIMVPYAGAGEAAVACLGGHVPAVSSGSVDLIPHMKAGTIKGLLALNNSRWKDYPDIPCITEKGYGFSVDQVCSFIGPKGLPEPIRLKLEDAFMKALKGQELVEWSEQMSAGLKYTPGKEYTERMKSMYYMWADLIKTIGIKF